MQLYIPSPDLSILEQKLYHYTKVEITEEVALQVKKDAEEIRRIQRATQIEVDLSSLLAAIVHND